jgi:nucleoside 2-deoxyribosyltransferase
MSGEARQIRAILADILHEFDVEAIRLEDLPATSHSVFESIRGCLNDADFVIADLTGHNPNVMWEVGFAQALNKPVLLLVNEAGADDIPFDVAGYLRLSYQTSPAGISELKHRLGSWVSRIKGSLGAGRGER